jgi:hypothetical protein
MTHTTYRPDPSTTSHRGRRRGIGALLVALALIVVAMPATLAQTEADLSADAAARDLWLYHEGTLTWVDDATGQVKSRFDVSHPECPASSTGAALTQSDGRAVWVLVVNAEWEAVVIECVIRVPADGSATEVFPIPGGRKPTFLNSAAAFGGDMWAVAWHKSKEGATLDYYRDWALHRLDPWTGSLDRIVPRIVAVAPSDAGLVVLFSDKGKKQPLRVGVVEQGDPRPREIPVAADLPKTQKGAYVKPLMRLSTGPGGTVALYDSLATGEIVVFDPASGASVGSVGFPAGATGVGRVYPVSDGVWMSGFLGGTQDFVHFLPFDGGPAVEIDPCADMPVACFGQLEAAGDEGAWVSSTPYDADFDPDYAASRFRRYAPGSTVPSLDVSGAELLGIGA